MRVPTYYQFQLQNSLLSKQYGDLGKYMAQINSETKIQHSSEDPVLAAQINLSSNYLANLNSYSTNVTTAETRAQLLAAHAGSVASDLSQVKVLLKQALNGSSGTATRPELASQMRGLLTSMLSVANAQDPASGGYIFSGFNTDTMPFSQSGTSYQYQGGMQSSMIDIGPSASAVYNESGYNVFGNIFQGNGSFTVSANAANTGGATTDSGSINLATYIPDNYTISFVTNGGGDLAYQVTDNTTSSVIVPASAATKYVSGAPISFNGVTVAVSNMGQPPNVGDSFAIKPSQKQDIFTFVSSVAAALEDTTLNQGQLNQLLIQADTTLTQATNHMISYQAEVGTRSVAIKNQGKSNQDLILNQSKVLSGLQDLDMPTAVSAMMQKRLSLEMTTEAYKKMQDTLTSILRL
jgi:flagellar hook-associated protein 3 FlgL